MRRAILLSTVFLAATSLFLLGGCEAERSAVPLEKVTIACSSPPYTALVDIAMAKGYFRKVGLEVTPHFHSSGKASLDEVLAGGADFATVAETPAMFAVMNGSKISIVATIQSSDTTDAILARKDKGITAPQDLKGKRIAATLGSFGEYFLDTFLATHGLDRKDVRVVGLKPEQIPGALAKGEIDAAATWDPFLSRAQQELGEKVIAFLNYDLYMKSFNLVTTQELIRTNPGRVRKMLQALIEAENFAARHPAEAQKVVSDFRQVDKAVLAEDWGGQSLGVTLDQKLLLMLEDQSLWAIKSGLTNATKIPNYLDFIYLDGLQAVKPTAVRIVR
jgi:ABC-type nitrate/sulfonate/bicarbonate transport system substrate-binding protein